MNSDRSNGALAFRSVVSYFEFFIDTAGVCRAWQKLIYSQEKEAERVMSVWPDIFARRVLLASFGIRQLQVALFRIYFQCSVCIFICCRIKTYDVTSFLPRIRTKRMHTLHVAAQNTVFIEGDGIFQELGISCALMSIGQMILSAPSLKIFQVTGWQWCDFEKVLELKIDAETLRTCPRPFPNVRRVTPPPEPELAYLFPVLNAA